MAELNPEEQRQLCSGFFYFWSDYGRIRDAVGKKRFGLRHALATLSG